MDEERTKDEVLDELADRYSSACLSDLDEQVRDGMQLEELAESLTDSVKWHKVLVAMKTDQAMLANWISDPTEYADGRFEFLWEHYLTDTDHAILEERKPLSVASLQVILKLRETLNRTWRKSIAETLEHEEQDLKVARGALMDLERMLQILDRAETGDREAIRNIYPPSNFQMEDILTKAEMDQLWYECFPEDLGDIPPC